MKDMKDDELQELIQQGELHNKDQSAAAKSYSSVFSALDKAPPHGLADGLSNRVLQALEKREEKSSWRHFIPLVVVSVFFLLFVLMVLVILDSRILSLSLTAEWGRYLLIGIAMIILVQLADKKLIKTSF